MSTLVIPVTYNMVDTFGFESTYNGRVKLIRRIYNKKSKSRDNDPALFATGIVLIPSCYNNVIFDCPIKVYRYGKGLEQIGDEIREITRYDFVIDDKIKFITRVYYDSSNPGYFDYTVSEFRRKSEFEKSDWVIPDKSSAYNYKMTPFVSRHVIDTVLQHLVSLRASKDVRVDELTKRIIGGVTGVYIG